MLANLIAAEWLKLSRRPLAWILLGVFLGLMILYLSVWLLVIALHEGVIGGGQRFAVLGPAQVAQLKLQLSFPGVFGAVLGQVNSVGGICAIILAAGAVGSDFGWGTLRVQLTRAPRRSTYLLAKLVALLLGLVLAVLVALLAGSLFALAASAVLGLPNRVGVADIGALALGVARALYIILPYLLLTIACAIGGRSVLAGVGGGLIFLALDVSAGSLSALGAVDQLVLTLLNLLLQPNINALVVQNSQLFGLDQSVLAESLDLALLPPPWAAMLVVAAYCALFYTLAWRALNRRDVGGAQ